VYKVVKISDQELAVKEFLVGKDEYQRETSTNVFEMFIYFSSINHPVAT